MPNRIIKESFFTDERVASLTDFDFRLWIGLITIADNNGKGDARASIIRGKLFPLQEYVISDDVSISLQAIEEAGLIEFSNEDGKPKFSLCDWWLFQPDDGRRTKEYRNWRESVFRRDNYTCQRCGKRGGTLNAHHIIRYRSSENGRTNIENGITLCADCHKAVHHEEGR